MKEPQTEKEIPSEGKDVVEGKVPLFPSCRVTLCLIGFVGGIARAFMGGNINLGIVCMTIPDTEDSNTTAGNSTTFLSVYDRPLPWYSDRYTNPHFLRKYGYRSDQSDCPNQLGENDYTGTLDWSRDAQGLILSGLSYGAIITTFAGGYLANRYSAKAVIGGGMGGLIILTLISPVVAEISPYLFFVVQMLKGATGGLFWSPFYVLWADWAPPAERSKLVNFMYSGVSLGAVFQTLATGFLCEYVGWESIFYVYGAGSAIWLAFWMFFVYDTPSKHPRISSLEREYIEKGTQQKTAVPNKTLPVPWKSMVLSKAIWACVIADFCYLWGIMTSSVSMPRFMADIMQLDIASNGVYNSLPYLLNWIITIIGAMFCDWIISKGMRRIRVRKIMQSLGFLVALPCVFVVGFLDCHDVILAVAMLTLYMGCLAFCRNGSLVNLLEIAPRYVGITKGFSTTFGMIPGFVSPSVTAALVPTGTQEEWRNVFFICGALNLFGAVVYLFFAEGEVLPWAKVDDESPGGQEKDDIKAQDGRGNGRLHLRGNSEKELEKGVVNAGYSYDVAPTDKAHNTKF